MVKLMLLFKRAAESGTFDLHYARNLSLLRKMPDVVAIYEGSVVGSPSGESVYGRVVELHFESFEALDRALRSPEGVAAGKDLMAFAGKQVEMLFVEIEDKLSSQPLGPAQLQAFLEEHAIEATIVYPGKPTPTVPAAAEALGVDADQIVKSVVFLVDEQPFLVYGCGTRRVDPRKLAARLNVSRKKVKLANAEQVLAITGYRVGTVPPLGLKTSLPSFMDPSIRQHDTVYAGGGGIDALLKISTDELLRVSHAEIAPMLRDEPPADSGVGGASKA